MSNNNSTSGGIGFTSLLLIAFIVLKLCKVINWSWWWVLSPAWIPAAIALILLIVYVAVKLMEKEKERPWVGGDGRLKSKWQERLDQMKEAQRKAQELKQKP